MSTRTGTVSQGAWVVIVEGALCVGGGRNEMWTRDTYTVYPVTR